MTRRFLFGLACSLFVSATATAQPVTEGFEDFNHGTTVLDLGDIELTLNPAPGQTLSVQDSDVVFPPAGSVSAGSGSQNWLGTDFGASSPGLIGTITRSEVGIGFEVLQFDVWISGDGGTTETSAVVTFSGSAASGEVVETFVVSPGQVVSPRTYVTLEFDPAIWSRHSLSELRISVESPVNYIALDNFVYEVRPQCGDGMIVEPELCDSGANNSDIVADACRTDCRPARCGDSVIDDGEECDDGPANGNQPGACRVNCTVALCGDGILDDTEECDAGNSNADEPDACRSNCDAPRCGDGIQDSGEECDNGLFNNDEEPDACRTNCVFDTLDAKGSGCLRSNSVAGDSGGGIALFLVVGLVWGLSRRRRSSALIALALCIPVANAHAQSRDGFVVNRYEAPAALNDGLALQLPSTLDHLVWSTALTLDFSNQPFAVEALGRTDDETDIVSRQFGAHLNFALGLFDAIEINAAIPVILAQTGDAGTVAGMSFAEPDSSAFGNAQFGASAKLYGRGRGFMLGVTGKMFFPTGKEEAFTSDDDIAFRGGILTSWVLDSVTLAVESGVYIRPSREFANAKIGDEFYYRAGAYLPVSRGLRAIAELTGATSLRDPLVVAVSPLETLLGGQADVGRGLHLGAALGLGITEAVGTPGVRVLATVGWSESVEADPDGDGIKFSADRCPTLPEDFDGHQDRDGCPESDNDDDGIGDDFDDCPNEPEDQDGFQDRDGCPELDNDGDGLEDNVDECPREAEDRDGFEDSDGCPDDDNDKDGVVDGVDQCPGQQENKNGYLDDDGCPDTPPPPPVTELKADPISFESGKAILKADSKPAVEKVAKFMLTHPEIAVVEVQGHTSADGKLEVNQRLSQARAEEIVKWLVKFGVDASRLRAKGYGMDRPIADNDTPEGRAKNRRVEFKVVEQKLPTTAPNTPSTK